MKEGNPLTLLLEGWLCGRAVLGQGGAAEGGSCMGAELSNKSWDTQSTHCPCPVASQPQGTPSLRQGSLWELRIQALNKLKLKAKLSCAPFLLPCMEPFLFAIPSSSLMEVVGNQPSFHRFRNLPVGRPEDRRLLPLALCLLGLP